MCALFSLRRPHRQAERCLCCPRRASRPHWLRRHSACRCKFSLAAARAGERSSPCGQLPLPHPSRQPLGQHLWTPLRQPLRLDSPRRQGSLHFPLRLALRLPLRLWSALRLRSPHRPLQALLRLTVRLRSPLRLGSSCLPLGSLLRLLPLGALLRLRVRLRLLLRRPPRTTPRVAGRTLRTRRRRARREGPRESQSAGPGHAPEARQGRGTRLTRRRTKRTCPANSRG